MPITSKDGSITGTDVKIGQIRKSTKSERYYIILSISDIIATENKPDRYLLNVWDSQGWTDKESSSYLDKWTVPIG